MTSEFQLVLASSSPQRIKLLQSINIIPDFIIAPQIDETPLRREKPDRLALRLAEAKAAKIALEYKGNAFILAADTIIGTKAGIFEKATNDKEVKQYLEFFSGRKIYIKTAIAVIKVINGSIAKTATKLVTSSIKFKRLNPLELKHYLSIGKGINTSGGFAIEGYGETLIQNITGSYSGIIGLPIAETCRLLEGLGYDTIKSKS
jgi:septum formation protein